jgi:hypothetical protein
MAYDPMQYAVAKAGVIGDTSNKIRSSVIGVAQRIPEIIKRKNIDTELKQAYLNTLETFADKVQEISPETSRESAMIAGMRFYRKPIDNVDAKTNIEAMLSGDQSADKYLDDLKIKKFRSETGKPVETEGPAGPTYQPPGTPKVAVGQERTLGDVQKEVHNEMLREPRATVPETPTDVYQRGADLGITETPEFKSDYQRQQDVEAGLMYQPGTGRGTYASDAAAAGIDPSQGAAKEIGGTLMTEKDIAVQDRLKSAAEDRNRIAEERNRIAAQRARIAGLRAAMQQRKLASDERRQILRDQSKNETDRLRLEVQINKLQKDIKEKAGKVDPATYQPLISKEDEEAMFNQLEDLKVNLNELKDIGSDYEGLLSEKGGTVTNPKQPRQSNIPSRSGFEQWRKNRGQ